MHGVRLEIVERGQGRRSSGSREEASIRAPSSAARAQALARPSHPLRPFPDVGSIDTVDDLSYLYLDLSRRANLRTSS